MNDLPKPKNYAKYFVFPVLVVVIGALLTNCWDRNEFDRREVIAEKTRAENRARTLDDQQKAKIEKLFAEYLKLPSNNAKTRNFIDSGTGATKENVKEIVRHFAMVIRYTKNKHVNRTHLADFYGGPLLHWGQRFQKIGHDKSAISEQFSSDEKKALNAIGAAMNYIYSERSEVVSKNQNGTVSTGSFIQGTPEDAAIPVDVFSSDWLESPENENTSSGDPKK